MSSASWHELRAERFTLLTDGSAAALEIFARDLARFIAVVDRVVQAPAPNVPARFVLLTRETQESFLQPWMEGVILSGLSGFHSFVRADEHSPIHRHTLLHEFTHYLTLRNNAIAYPHWYVEGFAELLGSTRSRDDVMEVGAAPPHRIEELEFRRARHWKLEIEPLLAFDPNRGDHVATLDYASAWALVHFLHTSGERKAQLTEFLRLQNAGQSWEDAFAQAFPGSPEELAAAVDEHTRRIARGVPDSFLFLDLAQLAVDSEWEIRKLTRSEADVVLGETAMTYGNETFAEALFRDAVAHAPGDMRARTALVAALAARGRFDEARELAARIEVSALSDADSLAHLASALHAEAERMSPVDEQTSMADRDDLFARAQSLYERATEIDPRSPVAWAGVARSRVARGNPNGALDAFEKASQAGERDGALMLDWGLAEKLAGREMEARIRWSFVLRQGTESQRKRAAELIAELTRVEDAPPAGDSAS